MEFSENELASMICDNDEDVNEALYKKYSYLVTIVINKNKDTLNNLNDKFNQLDNGSFVNITFYYNGKYSEIKGRVTNIDYIKKKIQINKEYNINICDIVSILI